MAIKTGIGVGAAQIADTSGIMNTYARQQAQAQREQAIQSQREYLSAEKATERAEREAARFDENLEDIMASAKTSGARDVDFQDITKSYNEIKDFYSKAGSLKDSDKPLFRAELRNRINSLNEYAQRSEKLSKDALAISSDIAKNEWDYDPASVADINDILKTPLSKLGERANIDPQRYKRLPNFGLIDTIIDDTYKIGKENAKFAGEIFDKGKRFNVEKVDPAFIQNNLVQRFTSSPEALKAVSSLYVRELGKQPTNEELTSYIVDKYKTKHGFDYVGEARDLKEAKETTDAEKTESVYADYVNRAVGGDTKAWRQLEALGGGNFVLAPSPLGDRYLRVIPNKTQKIPLEGGMFYERQIEAKPIDINRDATKLFKYLQKYNIKPSGSKSVSKLKDNTTSTPNKKELTWVEKQDAKNKK